MSIKSINSVPMKNDRYTAIPSDEVVLEDAFCLFRQTFHQAEIDYLSTDLKQSSCSKVSILTQNNQEYQNQQEFWQQQYHQYYLDNQQLEQQQYHQQYVDHHQRQCLQHGQQDCFCKYNWLNHRMVDPFLFTDEIGSHSFNQNMDENDFEDYDGPPLFHPIQSIENHEQNAGNFVIHTYEYN